MNIKQRFRQSLICGTGEAYLLLKANPNIDFSRDIEKAALTNYAYDPQCEGDRAFYAAQLIELSGKKEQIVETILKALATERKDCWVLDQLFELAAIFAKKGNIKAKKAIYKRFHKKVIKHSEWLGEDVILEFDGIEGLKYIANEKGKVLTKDSDEWDDGFTVDYFQDENPNFNAYAELKKAAKNNPFIKKYLEEIAKNKALRSKTSKRPKFDYQFVKERIDYGLPFSAPPVIAKKLSKIDLKKLADDFLQEKDLIKKEKYLSVFTKRKFPYDYQEILKIAKGKNSKKNRLLEFACRALSFFKAKDIRQFAIKKLSRTNIPAIYLPLLISNFKNSDHKLLSEIANRYKNKHIIHCFVWHYIDIFKANKTKQCKKPLEIIYGKLNCCLHRYDILKILHENNVLSKKILKEMEFDCSDEIRDFYKEICN